MKILLDTHMVIICCSTVSLWEIAIKNQKNPEKCPYHEKMILEYCMAAGYELIHIVPSHILAVRNLRIREGRTLSNLDPFDRLLIAQAKTENLSFLTHDSLIPFYEEKCIIPV